MSSHFGSDLQIPIPDLVTRCNQDDVFRLPAQSILSLDQSHTPRRPTPFCIRLRETTRDTHYFFVILHSFYTPEFSQLLNYLYV